MGEGLTDTQDEFLRETASLARATELSLKIHLTECSEQRKLFAERMSVLSDELVSLDSSVSKLTDRIVRVAAWAFVVLVSLVGSLLAIIYNNLAQ